MSGVMGHHLSWRHRRRAGVGTGCISGACPACRLCNFGWMWRLALAKPLGSYGASRAPEGTWRQEDHPEGYRGSEGPGRGQGGEAFSLLSA